MEGVTDSELPEAHRKFAEVIGVEAALRLCEEFGGSSPYVPTNDAIYKVAVRNREICRRYLLGAKVGQLARQYGVSERSVLRIVKDIRPNQISLFDSE